jgi:hypothetical protein
LKVLCTLGLMCLSIPALACEPEMIYAATDRPETVEMTTAQIGSVRTGALNQLAPPTDTRSAVHPPTGSAGAAASGPLSSMAQHNALDGLATELDFSLQTHRSASARPEGSDRLALTMPQPFVADGDGELDIDPSPPVGTQPTTTLDATLNGAATHEPTPVGMTQVAELSSVPIRNERDDQAELAASSERSGQNVIAVWTID